MAIRGGTPVSISFGGDEFIFTGDATPEIDDGVEVTKESNADRSVRKIFKYNPWSATGCVVKADADIWERLKTHRDAVDDPDCTIALSDGVILNGNGSPDSIKYNPSSATCSFDASGEDSLKEL